MCGIAGIINCDHKAPIQITELCSLRDQMIRRGPDGAGLWIAPDKQSGLAHRRLSIIDLSEKGSQPMRAENLGLTIVFNGEIYNYRELKADLADKGYQFRSTSDTEVLLYLYAEYREEMLSKLRGMFAFAIWDETVKDLFVARDPFGIKPFYYSYHGGVFRFASQVKALLNSGAVPTDADPAGWVGFYLFGSVPEPFTTYQKVECLAAGHSMHVNRCGPQKAVPFFSVAEVYLKAEREAFNEELSDNDFKIVGEALQESVRYHFVADVPVGVFLSSGIDSTAIASMAYSNGYKNIVAITLAFKEFSNSANDELLLAQETARQLGLKHHIRYLDLHEFKSDLPDVMSSMDQPSIDGINTYFVAKAAKEAGLKVVLSGLGGDELLGGYPSFYQLPRWVSCMKKLGLARRALVGYRPFVKGLRRAGVKLNTKWDYLFSFEAEYPEAYFLKRGLFMADELSAGLLSPEFVNAGLERLNLKTLLYKATDRRLTSRFSQVAVLESALYLKNQLLRDADWAGMAHSIEIRVPFVDVELLKQLATITVRANGRYKKKDFFKRLSGVSKAVLDRKKTGFLIPYEKWLSENTIWQTALTSVGILNQRGCSWARKWAYLVKTYQNQISFPKP